MQSQKDFDPAPGESVLLEPGIRRVLAPNPSPMTFRGTNTYLIGMGEVAVIDPGPALPAHMQAIQDALAPGERITHILVTHSHLDHSPLAAPLFESTGAAIYAFGDSLAGRSAVMTRLAQDGVTAGGEGVDATFSPHELLGDTDTIDFGGHSLSAHWTPGHFGNHLCFAMGDILFTGDHIMGWASSLVSPPDGDLTDFMASTTRLAARNDRAYYPGHGAPILQPAVRARWLLQHRKQRETQILAHLPPDGCDISTLTQSIYTEPPRALIPAAERNVFAHLIDLHGKDLVSADPNLSINARYFKR